MPPRGIHTRFLLALQYAFGRARKTGMILRLSDRKGPQSELHFFARLRPNRADAIATTNKGGRSSSIQGFPKVFLEVQDRAW